MPRAAVRSAVALGMINREILGRKYHSVKHRNIQAQKKDRH